MARGNMVKTYVYMLVLFILIRVMTPQAEMNEAGMCHVCGKLHMTNIPNVQHNSHICGKYNLSVASIINTAKPPQKLLECILKNDDFRQGVS